MDRRHCNNGLRISSLELDDGWFAAVWRPGEGARWWRSGMRVEESLAIWVPGS